MIRHLVGYALLLSMVACGSFVEKKILQEKDYALWQRDLTVRLAREPQNGVLLHELLDVALVNEDFATVIQSSRKLREIQFGDERQLLLTEIAALRHAWKLDECVQKITAYAALYPKDSATEMLLKQKPLIEKSKLLPPPLPVSPYARSREGEFSYVRGMQAPELLWMRGDEKSELRDLRKQLPVPGKLWATTKTPLPGIEDDDHDTDILHFPSGTDYGRVTEPALQQLKKDNNGISLLHADFSQERLTFLTANCSLPAMSPRGDFFVVSCPRGNNRDLLLYVRQGNEWKETAIKDTLNTEFDELSPGISPDGRFLFFSSDGLPGYGGFDYYYAKIEPASDCAAGVCANIPRFSAPVNFGPQINTYHNEIYPLNISPLSNTVHFAAQGKKNGLVGKAPVPGAIRIAETLSYRFVAYQGTAAPRHNITLTALKNGTRAPLTLIAGAKTDWVRLPVGAEYDVAFESLPGQLLHFRIKVPAPKQNDALNYRVERFSFQSSPEAMRMTYAEDATGVSNAIRPEIERVADRLRAAPALNALIEGHTDNIGGEAYNQGLSEKRAEAIRRQLITLGIAPERITARGWGQIRPLNGNANAEERAINRRVEILIVPQ